MTKKTINNFANEDALESFNLQRLHLQVRGSRGNGCLSALSVENRHRIPDTNANYSKSNIQHPKFQTSSRAVPFGKSPARF